MIRKNKNKWNDETILRPLKISKQMYKYSAPEGSSRNKQMSTIPLNQMYIQRIQNYVPFEQSWQQNYIRRQNYLNSLFNKRKAVLENISKKNKDIYIRINNQESHYCSKKLKQNKDYKSTGHDNSLKIHSKQLLDISRNALQSKLPNEQNIQQKQIFQKIDKQNTNRIKFYQIETNKLSENTNRFPYIDSRYQKQGLISFNSVRSNSQRNQNENTRKNMPFDLYINI